MEQGLAIRQQELGDFDRFTLQNEHDMALVATDQGDNTSAEQILIRNLAKRSKYLGESHEDTVDSMHNLAHVYLEFVQYDDDADKQKIWLHKAEKLADKALDIDRGDRGDEDPATLDTMSLLSSIYSYQRRLPEAQKLSEYCFKQRTKVLGADHQNTIQSMGELAQVYCERNFLDKAEELEERVLEIRKLKYEENHPETHSAMANLAETRKLKERDDEAMSMMTRSVEGCKQVLGEDHPTTQARVATLREWTDTMDES